MSVFVDLDNLYIIDDKVRPKVLSKRLGILKKMMGGSTMVFFGNQFTQSLLEQYDLLHGIKFLVTDIEANSADHNLINTITKNKSLKKVIVVSGDKTLCRLALFLNPRKHILFLNFNEHDKVVKSTIDFCFHKRIALEKFMKSASLYSTRYNVNKD